MAIKIGNRKVGENPTEQLKLEKERFKSKERRKDNKIYQKLLELEELGKGNKSLFDFEKNDIKNKNM